MSEQSNELKENELCEISIPRRVEVGICTLSKNEGSSVSLAFLNDDGEVIGKRIALSPTSAVFVAGRSQIYP